jgi:nitroimidazol reductase NimA-like FMN-containing flavoprotein (pyridoxamine 5'-phosphate oxidase superfamily)
MLPADEALEFGVEYASVVVFGRGSVVEDPKEAEAALVSIMEKYAPHLKAGVDYRPVAPEEIRRTAVLRIDIEEWSGKEKTEAPDFPGAYWFDEVRGE